MVILLCFKLKAKRNAWRSDIRSTQLFVRQIYGQTAALLRVPDPFGIVACHTSFLAPRLDLVFMDTLFRDCRSIRVMFAMSVASYSYGASFVVTKAPYSPLLFLRHAELIHLLLSPDFSKSLHLCRASRLRHRTDCRMSRRPCDLILNKTSAGDRSRLGDHERHRERHHGMGTFVSAERLLLAIRGVCSGNVDFDGASRC